MHKYFIIANSRVGNKTYCELYVRLKQWDSMLLPFPRYMERECIVIICHHMLITHH